MIILMKIRQQQIMTDYKTKAYDRVSKGVQVPRSTEVKMP